MYKEEILEMHFKQHHLKSARNCKAFVGEGGKSECTGRKIWKCTPDSISWS